MNTLDEEVLAKALVTAFRDVGTRNRRDLPKDGWPAYWTHNNEASVLLVNDLAAAIAAEYVRFEAHEQDDADAMAAGNFL